MTKTFKNNNNTEDSKLYAFLGIFLPLVGFLIVYLTRKEDKYALFYAKQGLTLFIFAVAVSVVNMILAWIPILGWLMSFTLGLCLLVIWIVGIVYAFSGEEKDIPIIGSIAHKINL